jgi:hypothetical protein
MRYNGFVYLPFRVASSLTGEGEGEGRKPEKSSHIEENVY